LVHFGKRPAGEQVRLRNHVRNVSDAV
jgi:hypothetical protein